MLAAVGIAVTFTGALFALAQGAANAGDAALGGAQKTGIAVEAYQELAYAASQSNLEEQDLQTTLLRQAGILADVASGTKTAVDAYSALGLSQKDLKGLGTDEAFELTATKLAAVTDEQKRLQLATDLYGAQLAGKLMPLLSEGGAGIQDLRAQAQALGLVMSGEDAQAAADFNDQLSTLWQVITSVRNEIGLRVIPIAKDLITTVTGWIAKNRELIDQRIERWMDTLVRGFELAADAAIYVDDVVQKTFGGWGPILGAAAAIVAVVTAAIVYLKVSAAWAAIVAAIEAIGVAFGLTFGEVILVAGVAVAAIVLLGLVVQDLWTFFRGGDSVTGRLIERFPVLRTVIDALKRVFGEVGDTAQRVWALVKIFGDIWWDVFSRTSLPVLKLFGAAILWLGGEALAGLGFWLNNVVVPGFQVLGAIFDWVIAKAQAFAPVLQTITGGLDSFLALASQVTGVDLGGGAGGAGVAATAGAGAGTGGFSTAGFAPSTGEVTGGTAGGTGSATTNVTTQGNQITINGIGMTAEEAQALIDANEASRARETAQALAGAEV